jgi:diphthamide biosynthesis protein 3
MTAVAAGSAVVPLTAHAHYDKIALVEVEYDAEQQLLHFPCPCGDIFELKLAAFAGGDNVAECPTCSLTIAIVCTEDERAAFLAAHA